VHILQRGSGKRKVLESHLGQFVNHHVHHFVATTEMVVERDSHAVFQATLADSLFEGHQFGRLLLEQLFLCGIFDEVFLIENLFIEFF
jgi:hypothetical protein